jgi:hypothetical protein
MGWYWKTLMWQIYHFNVQNFYTMPHALILHTFHKCECTVMKFHTKEQFFKSVNFVIMTPYCTFFYWLLQPILSTASWAWCISGGFSHWIKWDDEGLGVYDRLTARGTRTIRRSTGWPTGDQSHRDHGVLYPPGCYRGATSWSRTYT